MINHQPLIPVILSGGSGTRLWPVSRESHPKPFMVLPDGQSLLQKTFLRAAQFEHAAEILTITNKEYYLKHLAEYESAGNADQNISLSFLLEPFARNTAPAIALAALRIVALHGSDAIMLVMPADHLITPVAAFASACHEAIRLAAANHLVTFGIKPTTAETGFGYIELGKQITSFEHSYYVQRFVEKPSKDVAEMYLTSGSHLWNAGLFCFKASTLLAQFKQHAPELLSAATSCWQASYKDTAQTTVIDIDAATFSTLENISIDYAIMEKSADITTLACDFNWQDIGSWEAYKQLLESDQQGNTIVGNAILIDSTNNFIQSETRMVASIGIQNLTIIDTPDAVLITHRDRAQDVKQIVSALKSNAHESCMTHRTVIRPWGTYTVLEEGPAFKIKRISVKPRASLSLQKHTHRSEHWVVVTGTANIVNGDKEYLLNTNESTFVPIGTPHRLSNPTDDPLILIEVQTGAYLGEDDIIRIEDTYGRVT